MAKISFKVGVNSERAWDLYKMPITASSNCAFSFVLGPWFTEIIESLAQTGNVSLAATKTVDTAGDWIENSFLRSKSHFVLTCWFNAKFGFDRKAKFCEKLVFSVKFKHDLRLEVWEWCWYRESNSGPHPYQGCALPTEPYQHFVEIGGTDGDRTRDLLRDRQAF